jgi:hypothetical protein
LTSCFLACHPSRVPKAKGIYRAKRKKVVRNQGLNCDNVRKLPLLDEATNWSLETTLTTLT